MLQNLPLSYYYVFFFGFDALRGRFVREWIFEFPRRCRRSRNLVRLQEEGLIVLLEPLFDTKTNSTP